ncbi:hypothetical protein SADUNF_Sadunf02G0074800 [Salix dunnii]|uniref:Transmembrane protein 50A n=1 Tax=Salix dunnii TaxID=1413687 RepID=A0A835TJ22_9ROSI|nr:hypothetical protein SADUNF_Sadunf02G0074800 [Salix dunnii]
MDLPELWAIFGPAVAGAVFGTGWWFWIDAVVCSSVKVSFVHYLPGIFASIAALMFNCVRKEDIDYSPYEEGEWSYGFDIKRRHHLRVAFSVRLCTCFLQCVFCQICRYAQRFSANLLPIDGLYNLDDDCIVFPSCFCIDFTLLILALFGAVVILIEALAFLCICCLLRLFSSISGFVDSRFIGQNRAFSVDRNCWCFAVCVCADKVNGLLCEPLICCILLGHDISAFFLP